MGQIVNLQFRGCRGKPLHPVLCFVGYAKSHDNLYSHHGITLLTACQIFAICPCVR